MLHRMRRDAALACVIVALSAVGPARGAAQDSPAAQADEAELRDYLSANGLLNRGLYELAIADYRRFLSRHAGHEKAPVARYGLAVCLYRTGRFDDAAGELAPLMSLERFEFAPEAATILGQCRLAAGRHREAAEAFARVVRDWAAHELADDAAAGLVEALYQSGDIDAARSECRRFAARWADSPLRTRVQFFEALALAAGKKFAEAVDLLTELLRRGPDDALAGRAELLLAQCRHRAGQDAQAAQAYALVLKRGAPELLADGLLGLASLLLDQRRPEEAGELLERLLRDCPDSPLVPAALLAHGRTLFERQRYDEARRQFERAAERDPALADDAEYWTAKCALRSGDPRAAATGLAEAIGRHPQSDLLPEMTYDRAVALLRADDAEGTIQALDGFASRFAGHALRPDALHLAALAEHRLGHHDRSAALCREFLSAYSESDAAPAVRFLAAENEFLAGRFEQAAGLFRDLLRRHADHPQADAARLRLGLALQRLKRLDESAEVLADLAAPERPTAESAAALRALGEIHFERNEWDAAERRLSAYLAAGDAVADVDGALLKLGLARQRRGDYAGALQAYDRLVAEHGDAPAALQGRFERGQALLALGRDAEARTELERVLGLDGAARYVPYVLNHLGGLALRLGEPEKAAEHFDRLLAGEAPERIAAEAALGRAQAALALRDYPRAEAGLRAALNRGLSDEQRARARGQLALALARLERCDEALRLIDELEPSAAAHLDDPLRAAVAYERAWCLRRLGRPQDAAAAYRRLLETDRPADLVAHVALELAHIEFENKRYDEAARLLRRLRPGAGSNGNDPPREILEEGLYRLAVCEFELGRPAEAAALLEEFLQTYGQSPLAPSARYFCGEALLRVGRHADAAQHLTRLVEQSASDPNCGPAMLRLGECLAAQQLWARSERVFAEYLTRFPESEHWFQAQFGLGFAQENQGRHAEAQASYARVIERHKGPTAARAQFQIGECLFARGQFEEAARELLKVDILYAYPEWSAAALFEAGRCFEQLNQPARAREQFRRVVEQFPQTRWAELARTRRSEVTAGAPPGHGP